MLGGGTEGETRARGNLLIDGLAALVALFAAVGVVRITSLAPDTFLGNVPLDDAYYYLLPARHLTEGKGFSFDGVHRTNGVQPLWAAVVTLLAWLMPDRLLLARATCALSGALWVLAGVVLYCALRQWGRGAALLASTGWLATSGWNHVATIGMENGLHALLFALLLGFGSRHFAPGAHPPPTRPGLPYTGLGGLAALICLTRLETGLLGLILGLAIVSGRLDFGEVRTRRLNWRGAILFALPSVVLIGTYVGLGWLYFGEPFAISGPVKLFYEESFVRDSLVAGGPVEHVLAQLGRLADSAFWAVTAWLEPLPSSARETVEAWRRVGLAAVLGGGALGWWARTRRVREPGVAARAFRGSIVLFLAAHLTLMAVSLPRHAEYGTWYFSCEIMGLWIGAALSVSGLLRRLIGGLATPGLAAGALAIVVSARGAVLHPPPSVVTYPGAYVLSGRWIDRNLPAGQTIASIGAGGQAYLAPSHSQVNLDGLINDGEYFRSFLRQPRLAEYLRRERVGYIGELMPIATLGEGFAWINGRIPAEQLDLVWWMRQDADEAYCLFRLWPGSDPYPRDAVSRIQFDAEVRHRYRLIDEGQVAGVGPGERIVTSIVRRPSGQIRHVVATEAQVEQMGLSLLTIHPTHFSGAVFGGRLRLVGADLPEVPVRPGQALAITRYWEMLEEGRGFPVVTIETAIHRPQPAQPGASAGEPPLVRREVPCHGTSRVDRWNRGEVVTETSVLAVPVEWTPGFYPVSIGLRLENGEAMGPAAFVGNVEVVRGF